VGGFFWQRRVRGVALWLAFAAAAANCLRCSFVLPIIGTKDISPPAHANAAAVGATAASVPLRKKGFPFFAARLTGSAVPLGPATLPQVTFPVAFRTEALAPLRRGTQLHAEDGDANLESNLNPGSGKKLLVLGGGGYVGSEVCRIAVGRGYDVTSLSRRGENPDPGDQRLAAVRWVKGDAADFSTVKTMVDESDLVVHAIGLLFDVNSGLGDLNKIVSGSGSVPGESSTYDTVTRKTAFNLIEAVRQRPQLPFFAPPPKPVVFVSCAEAGWPDVPLGPQVENIAPQWLKEYLVAKRAVEAEITSSPDAIRPVMFRPSLIWSWTKFDVLPIIPIFNLLNAIGVPFVDKTVTVNTLASAIVAALEDDGISGTQRFPEMEALEQRLSS